MCLYMFLSQVVFREYGWPEKVPVQARFRAQQLRYRMDDYSSKGSQLTMLQKKHRSLQIALTQNSTHKGTGPPRLFRRPDPYLAWPMRGGVFSRLGPDVV